MSKQGFDRWKKDVFVFEGGFSNDTRDAGNWSYYDSAGSYTGVKQLMGTNRGIIWDTYRQYAAKLFGKKASYGHFKSMTVAEAEAVAYEIWKVLYGNAIKDDRLAIMIVYAHWGSMVGGQHIVLTAQKWLNNKGFNLVQDGAIGPKTVEAINALTEKQTTDLANHLLDARANWIRSLPQYKIYPGWEKAIDFLKTVYSEFEKK